MLLPALLFLIFSATIAESVSVNVTNGTINGFSCSPGVSCFLGVPFAQPPIGQHRFQYPLPPKRWSRPLNATTFAFMCAQLDEIPFFTYSEDCLYLNIFTPNVSPSSNYPVMLFIHGGSYIHGGTQEYGQTGIAQNLVSHGIVVVVIQYRLGVFGFMTTQTSELPANVGMLDQIQAMRWVQAEIANFGGDPNRVTIAGESAGSASVSLHTYSPLSRGLFTQAIMESGVSRNPWALHGNVNIRQEASKYTAIGSGCISPMMWAVGNFSGLRTCLQALPAAQLLLITKDSYPQNVYTWPPSVGTPEGFMPKWPRYLAVAQQLNMPIMIGNNRDENFPSIDSSVNFSIYDPSGLAYEIGQISEQFGGFSSEITRLLRDTYTPNAAPTDYLSWFNSINKLVADRVFYAGTAAEVASLYPTTTNIYLYSFDYLSDAYPYPMNNGTTVKGVPHAAELFYVFNLSSIAGPIYNWNFSPNDFAITAQFGLLWSNFVKFGNPNGAGAQTWGTYDPVNRAYYSININGGMNNYFHWEADNIWNSLVPSITHSNGPTFPASTPSSFPCYSNPCVNGGVCSPTGNPGQYKCACPSGFAGATCQFSVCNTVIVNRGAYVLQVTRDTVTGSNVVNYLAFGQQLSTTVVLNGNFKLSAVFGNTAKCSLAACPSGQKTISCSGTTLGIQCSNC